MKNSGTAIALLAGVAGGFLAHYLLPESAQAQAVEVRAQRLILTDTSGLPQAMFTLRPSPNGAPPAIILYRADGQVVWTAGGGVAPLNKQ